MKLDSEQHSAIPEKEDYADCGPMGDYDSEFKPECEKCNSKTFVTATGRDHKWEWTCTNCQTRTKPNNTGIFL